MGDVGHEEPIHMPAHVCDLASCGVSIRERPASHHERRVLRRYSEGFITFRHTATPPSPNCCHLAMTSSATADAKARSYTAYIENELLPALRASQQAGAQLDFDVAE